jgi:isoleucyl-tRNA synthetase
MESNTFTILDTNLTDELIEEGYVREVISKIQQLRKQYDFEMMDNINIFINADEVIAKAIEDNKEFIMKETLAKDIIAKEDIILYDVNGHKTGLDVERIGNNA